MKLKIFKKDKGRGSLSRREHRTTFVFLLPIFTLYTVFFLIPVGMCLYLSFTKYSVLESPKGVGLENYKYLFFEDDIFKVSLLNTSLYAVETITLAMIIGLLFAILLNRPLRGKGFFRSCIYLPYITPIVAAALVWVFMYEPSEEGFMNYLLSWFGIGPIDWLESVQWALPSIVIMGIWRTVGYNMVLFLAGLQGIPERYYEAASIDGASRARQFWYITLPLLKPITLFVLIMATITAFQVFQEPYVMTEGGPGHATTTVVYWLYLVSFRSLNFGKGSAISFILAIMIFILSIFYLKAMGLREEK